MKKKTVPIVVGILVVAAIVSAIYFYEEKKPSDDIKSQWISSGPFAIDKSRYKIGENIFMSVHDLKPDEVGNIIIFLLIVEFFCLFLTFSSKIAIIPLSNSRVSYN